MGGILFVTFKLSKLTGVFFIVLGVFILVFGGNHFIKTQAITASANVFREEYIIVVDARTWLP